MHINVVKCIVLSIMLSKDSGAHNVHSIITLISGHLQYVINNVGVMFEHSYYTCECIIIICTNGMGVRCSPSYSPFTLICETEPSDVDTLPFVYICT